MEYLIKTIENGAKECGSIAALEIQLELPKKTLYEVKAGRRGLSTEACFKLADLTGESVVRLIAESEAITAKAEKADFWKKKLHELEAMAACLILATVTTLVTPTPSQAAPLSQVLDSTVYIMSNCWRRITAFFQQLSTIFSPPTRFVS